MAWNLSGQLTEFCSCKLMCPCWFGPAPVPDQGWCSGAILYDIEQGQIDGIDVGGSKVVFAADWPGNFFGGQGTARLYIDDQAGPDQRRELEAVFRGQKGGLLEGLMGAVIAQWLPAQTARIVVQRGATLSLTVGTVGQVTLAPLVDPAGRPTTVQGTAAQAAFQSSSMQLASSQGTRWSDPDLRAWGGTLARCIRFSGVPSNKEGAAETFRPQLVPHGSDVPCASPWRTCPPDMMGVCSHRA